MSIILKSIKSTDGDAVVVTVDATPKKRITPLSCIGESDKDTDLVITDGVSTFTMPIYAQEPFNFTTENGFFTGAMDAGITATIEDSTAKAYINLSFTRGYNG